MKLSKMSAKDVLKAFFEGYRSQDFDSLRALCSKEITYINPEGLVSVGIDEFLDLLKKEFDSFGVLFEPVSWEVTVEKPSLCSISWKRGISFARKAALRRVEVFGSALLMKADGGWQLLHFQQAIAGSFAKLFRAKK